MEELMIFERPEASRPVMIMAFKGWNDASSAATYALEQLIRQLNARKFAYLDPDEYYDFTQERPYTRPLGDYARELTWPKNDFYHARTSDGRDLLLFLGTEPHLKWRRYGDKLISLAGEYEVTEVLALGALLADTPHTRPVPLSGGASSAQFGERLKHEGINPSPYEGPTGILSVLSLMLDDLGVPNGSIWASVPHYINASPNPKASASLLSKVSALFALDISLDSLNKEGREYDSQIESVMSGNLEAQQYVHQLEQRASSETDEGGAEREDDVDDTQAEGLIRSIEEYLRERENRQDNGPDG